MSRRYIMSFHSFIVPTLCGLGLLASGGTAGAVQPLSTFVEAARTDSFDSREQNATSEQRIWEARAAMGRLLPSLSARGTLTHNQYEAELPAGTFPGQTKDITIVPQNQWDATFQLDVPIVDLAQYARYDQAVHLSRAAELQKDSINSDLERAVAQAYYTFIGASALVDAAEKSLASAEENMAYVTSRNELGVATDLDRESARANLERTKQDLADANLIAVTAARNLETLSGLTPSRVEQYPVDDLRPEKPLESWIKNTDTPYDRVQKELSLAANSGKKAANRALLPTLSATAQERISNATGFTGQVSTYTLQAMLSWRLDYATYSNARAQSASADVQIVRAERARRTVEDAVFDAYHRVETSIIKSSSARAQAEASEKAASLALERYKVGAITQLDVTQSQREAFQAQASRVKADADLALARIVLRLAAGASTKMETNMASVDRNAPASPPAASSTAPSTAPSTPPVEAAPPPTVP